MITEWPMFTPALADEKALMQSARLTRNEARRILSKKLAAEYLFKNPKESTLVLYFLLDKDLI